MKPLTLLILIGVVAYANSVAGLALLVGMFVFYITAKIGVVVGGTARGKEFPANLRADPLSTQELHWTVVHIRDDIGFIVAALCMTNGLLAAIFMVLVLK